MTLSMTQFHVYEMGLIIAGISENREGVDSCPKNQLPTPQVLLGDYTEERTVGCLHAGEG